MSEALVWLHAAVYSCTSGEHELFSERCRGRGRSGFSNLAPTPIPHAWCWCVRAGTMTGTSGTTASATPTTLTLTHERESGGHGAQRRVSGATGQSSGIGPRYLVLYGVKRRPPFRSVLLVAHCPTSRTDCRPARSLSQVTKH